MLLPSDPCLFWAWSVWMFCRYCGALSIHVFVCNYGAPYLDSIELYFCYKMFLAECLHVKHFWRCCCSWSVHAMLLFLPCLASMRCLLAGCMLSLSCNALWWVHRARKHAYLISVLPCSNFLLSLNLLTIIAMFTWMQLYFLIPFGLWSVRDFCCMIWVASCHSLLCHDMFL